MQAHLSHHLSKCHKVGNHMLGLIYELVLELSVTLLQVTAAEQEQRVWTALQIQQLTLSLY